MRESNVNQSQTGDPEAARAVTNIDLGWSLAVTILAVIVCLRLGGFSFFAPWLIIIPVMMFATGLIRGGSPGRIIVRGAALSTFLLMLLLLAAVRSPLSFLVGIPVIVVPAVAGIATRRWWTKMKRIHST